MNNLGVLMRRKTMGHCCVLIVCCHLFGCMGCGFSNHTSLIQWHGGICVQSHVVLTCTHTRTTRLCMEIWGSGDNGARIWMKVPYLD